MSAFILSHMLLRPALAAIFLLAAGPLCAALPESFSITVTNAGQPRTLQLERYNLRSPGFHVRIYNDDTTSYTTLTPLPEVPTYRGRVVGDPRAVVSAVIKPNGRLRAQVVYGNWYQPVDPVLGTTPWSVDNVPTPYVPENNYTYALTPNMPTTVSAGSYPAFTNGFGGPRYLNNMQKFTPRRCRLAVDVVNDFFVNDCGSDLYTAIAQAESKVNDADLVTARDNFIAYELTCIAIRPTMMAPYTSSGTSRLGNLNSFWSSQRASTPYDKVAAFTIIGGGVAYLWGDFSIEHASWYGGVMAHEIGHNWGALDYEATRDYTGTNGYQHAMNGSGLTYCPESVNRAQHSVRTKSYEHEWIKYNSPLPPYATPDYATTTLNTPRLIDVRLNDYDVNSNALSIAWFTTNTIRGGTVALLSGALRYTPPGNFVGTDTFFYRVADGTGFESGTQVMVLTTDPADPLLAHYTFDQTNGLNVVEATGRGVNSRLAGGLDFAQDGVNGVSGRALHFDGNSYVELLNHYDPLDASVSVSLWVKPDATPTAEKYLFKKGYGGTSWGGWNLVAEPSRFRLYGNMFGNHDGSRFSVVANVVPQPDTWYHVVAQLDRASNLARLWLNGVEHTATASSRSLANGASGEYVVGNGTFILGNNFAGVMDDFRFYGKALTQAEITALYTSAGNIPAGGPSPADGERDTPLRPTLTWLAGRTNYQHEVYLGASLAAVQAATTTSPEFKGRQSATNYTPPAALLPATEYFWRVDEILGGTNVAPGAVWTFRTAVDELHGGLRLQLSLDGRDTVGGKTYDRAGPPFEDGTLNIAPPLVVGRVREGLDFNGSNQYVDIPALNLSVNTLTITAWVKRSGTLNNNSGLVFMRGSTASGLGIGSNNRLGYHWNDTAASYNFNSNLTLPDGEWAFAALVIEPNRAIFHLGRLNGTLTSATNNTPHAVSALTSNFRLASDSTSSSRYFRGSLDEVGIWKRALTRAEIGTLLTNDIAGGGIDGPIPPPDPGTFTWIGTSDTAWNNPANWATNAAPGSADTVFFNDASRQNLDTQLGQDFSVAGVAISGGLRTVGISSAGQTLTLGAGGLNLGDSIVAATIAAPVSLGANQVWGVGEFASLTVRSNLANAGRTLMLDAHGTATFNGVLSGAGALVKNGAGTATFTASGQTFTGGVTVNGGTLRALGGDWDSSFFANVSPRTLTLNSGARLETSTHSLGGLGGSFYQPTITLNEGATWQFNAEQYLNGGNLILRGATVEILANDLRVQGGTVAINSSSLPASVSGAGSITLHGNTTFNVANGPLATDFSVDVPIGSSGTRTLTKSGTGTMALNRPSNWTGATTISAGVLELGGDEILPAANAVTLSSGATLRLAGGNQTLNSLSGSGGIELGDNALTLNLASALTFGGLITGAAPAPLPGGGDTLPPSFGGLTKLGAGTLTLTANNSYTGPTYILEGSLQIGSDGNVGTAGTGDILNETQLIFRRGATAASYGNPIHGTGVTIKRSTGQITLTGSFTNRASIEAGRLVFAGPTLVPQLSLAASASIGPAGGLAVSDFLSLTGHRFTINPGATFGLTGNNIPGDGLLQLTGGTLSLLPAGGAGAAFNPTGLGLSVLEDAAVEVSACASVTLASSSVAAHQTLELIARTNATWATLLTGAGGLRKSGEARLTVSSASPLTGDTVITQGTLALSGAGSVASSNLILASGATLDATARTGGLLPLAPGQTLRGTGTVLGTVNVANAAAIAPGAGVGTLATGNQIWSGGGRYVCELNGTNSSACDLLALTGALNVQTTSGNPFTLEMVSLTSGGTPGPLPDFDPAQPCAWTIATTTGGVLNFDAVKFAVNTAAFSNDFTGGRFTVAVTGNDLVVQYLPQPTISLTSPADGASFALPAVIPLTANVDARGNTITSVQFFAGANLLHEDLTAPYAFDWTSATPGAHPLSAVALYDAGSVGSVGSATVGITVFDPTPPGLSASLAGNLLSLQLTGVPGQHYRVEYQPALPAAGPWQVLADIPALAASPFTVPDPATNGARFYRAVAVP